MNRLTAIAMPAHADRAAANSAAGFGSPIVNGAKAPVPDAGAFFMPASAGSRDPLQVMAGGAGEPQGSPDPLTRSTNPASSVSPFGSGEPDSNSSTEPAMSTPLGSFSRALDRAVVLGFIYGVALTSVVWIAFMAVTGGAR